MANSTTSLICNKFSGISRTSAVFLSKIITASDMQNVELYYTGLNSGVGIRTMRGNKSICDLVPTDENIINLFESVQGGAKCCFVHTESATEGKIYQFSETSNTFIQLISGLTLTGKSCGTDYSQGFSDYFVFTNSIEFYHIELNASNPDNKIVNWKTKGYLVDRENRPISGLGLVNFDGRLWIFNNLVLWYSVKGTCYDFNNSTITSTDTTDVIRAGYIEFTKNITAIKEYLGSLAVFHSDSSNLISVNSDYSYTNGDESPGGCASYNSLVFHDTNLYFYDHSKKGIYSFQQVVNGDKTLGTNIALDILEELSAIKDNDISKIKTVSYVTDNRNEVWFLIPISDDDNYSTILIFDFLRSCWTKRKSQRISCLTIVNNKLLSGGRKIYEENIGDNFDGSFIPCFYNCSPCNLGVDNTFKITKFPPRVTVDATFENDFFVKYVKDYDYLKTPKIKHIVGKTIKNVLYYDVGSWDLNRYIPKKVNSIYKLSAATFKTIEIDFYTNVSGQEFCISAIEMSEIKVKQL